MRSKSKPTAAMSGGARLAASGKRPILLGVSAEQHDLLRAAADAESRYVTQFVLHHALAAARKNLAKIPK